MIVRRSALLCRVNGCYEPGDEDHHGLCGYHWGLRDSPDVERRIVQEVRQLLEDPEMREHPEHDITPDLYDSSRGWRKADKLDERELLRATIKPAVAVLADLLASQLAGEKRSGHCRMPGCGKPLHARGVCRAHYARYFKRGYDWWRIGWAMTPPKSYSPRVDVADKRVGVKVLVSRIKKFVEAKGMAIDDSGACSERLPDL